MGKSGNPDAAANLLVELWKEDKRKKKVDSPQPETTESMPAKPSDRNHPKDAGQDENTYKGSSNLLLRIEKRDRERQKKRRDEAQAERLRREREREEYEKAGIPDVFGGSYSEANENKQSVIPPLNSRRTFPLSHQILDQVFPQLKPAEQAVLLRLLRLAHDANSDTFEVSVMSLARACNLAERKVLRSIRSLEHLRHVQVLEDGLENINQTKSKIRIRVLLQQVR